MFQVRLSDRFGRRWHAAGSYTTTGYLYDAQRCLEGRELAEHLHSTAPAGEMRRGLADLNGQFAFVFQHDNELWAAVDRLRSIPLFHARRGDDLWLSDDPYWIRSELGENEPFDSDASTDYLLTGYVTGHRTLDPRIRQLQAGETLQVRATSKGLQVEFDRYYRFLHDERDQPEEGLLQRLDEVALDVARRLVAGAENRTLVLPLSGGYDSRLLAVLLRRLGYDDVFCFSYGVPGNSEAEVSRQVAEKLNYRWEFVSYSATKWRDWFNSEPCRAYCRFGEALVSVPHLQDWPAVFELQQRGVLPARGLFVPGHTGDFISGGHIPVPLLRRPATAVHELVRAIEHKHFSLQHPKCASRRDWSRVRERLMAQVRGIGHDAADAYECWEWQERQAKFICNSLRVYEYFGFEWRIPLWDAAMMDFWAQVPQTLRFGRRLYIDYVNAQSAAFGLTAPLRKSAVRSKVSQLLARLGLTKMRARVQYRKNARNWRRMYDSHFLAWFGAVPPDLFAEHYTGREHLNSFLVKRQLGTIEF